MKKKHVILSLGLVFVLALTTIGIYLTTARFTSSDKVLNKGKVGYIDTSIVEEDYEDNKEVKNGDKISKKVFIKNETKNDALIRTSITARWVNPDNTKDIYEIKDDDVKFIFDEGYEKYWEKGSDGYFYYKQLLHGEEKSKCLLKEVYVSQNLDSRYDDMELKIDIKTEAVEPTKIENSYLFSEMWKSLKDDNIAKMLQNLVDDLYEE